MDAKYEKLLKKHIEKAVKLGAKTTAKTFSEGMHFGFKEGISVAQDYVNTLVFQEDAEYPISGKELKELFGTSDPQSILLKHDIKSIMKTLKKYRKQQ